MRVARSLLCALACGSLWISFGTLAVLDSSTARLGALPPAWLLVLLVVVGAIVGWLTRVSASALWPLALTTLLWLPWLPMPVPAAFLMWSGPLELVVWTAAVGGVLASFAPPRLPVWLAAWVSRPSRAPVMAAAIGLCCAVVAAQQIGDRIPAGDEPHYLIIAQSLLLDGDLQIENNHRRRDFFAYFDDLPRPDFLRRGTNGQIYSVHAPGLPALVAPAFAIAGYHGVVIFVALLVAIGGATAWHAAWLITGSATAAWMGWTAVFFSAPVFFHAFTVYPDGAGAVFGMAAVWLLVRLDVDTTPVSRLVLVAVGAALAMLPWLHSRFALVAAGLGLAILVRLFTSPDRWRQVGTFLVVPVISASAWFGFFKIIYGTFNPTAPYGSVVQNRLATLQPGLPGLFFDQQFGLVTNAPIFAVAVIGLVALARHRPRLVAELALIGVPYVLAVASYAMWWAGHSAPARFLTILLLPAAIPVAWLFHNVAAVWARAAVVAAAIVGGLFVVMRVSVNSGLLLYNGRDGYDLLLDWLSPAVNLPLAFPSFHRDVVRAAFADTLTWAVAMSVALVVLWLSRRWGCRSRGTAWAVSGGVLASMVMAASTLVWARYGTDRVITPPSSQAAFLEEWNPHWHSLELQLEPIAILTHESVLPRLDLETSNRGPRVGATRPLLYLPLVPAGEYEVVVDGAARSAGTLEVFVGRSAEAIERFDLSNRPTGYTGLMLRVPVLVHSITIRGDATASAAVSAVRLRPLRVRPPADRLTSTYAHRATRYGAMRVFFFDEDPFMEAPGFWTAGGKSTAVLVDPDEGGPSTLLLRAGAVPTNVSLSSGQWHVAYDLSAGQLQEVELPRPSTARPLTITTTARFRPADIDPSNTDLRELGVWVEFPR
jgi:hypothetical protein